MELPLKVSERMNKNNMWFGSPEKTFVRMPQELRDKCGFNLGDMISFRLRNSSMVALQVAAAYKEDLEADSSHAYVTSEIFKLIGIEDNTAGKHDVDLVTGITIGCDPEFFLVKRDNRELIRAGRFFNKGGAIGYDHNGSVMEIRPLPSVDELVVSSNILNLINRARIEIDRIGQQLSHLIMMYGASFYKPMTAGFHVHFGLPTRILGPGHFTDAVAMQIVKALDYYVGIPCVVAEGSEDYKRRTQPYVSYGKPGGYILDSRTLEYRVPGGSLLRHPVLSRGLLGLGAVVVEDAVSRIRKATDDFVNLDLMSTNGDIKQLYPNLPDVYGMYLMMCNKNTEAALSQIDTIIEDVEQMISFENRKRSVQDFFTSILSGETFDNDIEYNWRKFYHEEQQRQMDILRASV